MPASSIDTFFACSLMVLLIMSAMVGSAKIVQPHITQLTNQRLPMYYKALADYLLLNPGTPSNWGKENLAPDIFGLALENEVAYTLDLDKVSRLNENSTYSINYAEIISALGVKDISLRIEIQPLFEISINLISSESNENETTYSFNIITSKSGFPISAYLQSYVILGGNIDRISSETDATGANIMNATLSNSMNGTALLAVFAIANSHSKSASFNVCSFGHNSELPRPNQSFLNLSPLNHVLNVSYEDSDLLVSDAYVFSFDYCFNLSQTSVGNQTLEYTIPRLLEASPSLIVLGGTNDSISFIEWSAYPPVPVEVGADFSDQTTESGAIAVSNIVSINSVLYKAVIIIRSLQW